MREAAPHTAFEAMMERGGLELVETQVMMKGHDQGSGQRIILKG